MITQEQIKATIERAEKQIEEMKELLETMEAEQGRAPKGEIYWYIDNLGAISSEIESGSSLDGHRFDTGNYYLSKKEMVKTEKKVLLFRLLDRFSRQNGWTDDIWEGGSSEKFYIYFDNSYKTIEINSVRISRQACRVYFLSAEIAQQAIEKYFGLIMDVMAI